MCNLNRTPLTNLSTFKFDTCHCLTISSIWSFSLQDLLDYEVDSDEEWEEEEPGESLSHSEGVSFSNVPLIVTSPSMWSLSSTFGPYAEGAAVVLYSRSIGWFPMASHSCWVPSKDRIGAVFIAFKRHFCCFICILGLIMVEKSNKWNAKA